jgi:hypothetical protein
LRNFCENILTRILIIIHRHYAKIGGTEGVTNCTSIMKYLEVQSERKWLSDSEICVGEVSIRKLEE